MAGETDELLTQVDNALGSLLEGEPVSRVTHGSKDITYLSPSELLKVRRELQAEKRTGRVRHADFTDFRS